MNEFIKDLGLLINAMLIATPPLLYAALGSCISEPVSYTHLDVYKRQTMYCFLFWERI